MPVLYASPDDRAGTAKGPSGPRRRQQLDTALLERLLHSPGVHPSVFGSRVLRAFILFKWNYFTRYFIILQVRVDGVPRQQAASRASAWLTVPGGVCRGAGGGSGRCRGCCTCSTALPLVRKPHPAQRKPAH